jgi:UDP-N-acetyl-D-glucosamine dehydrogenase
MVRVESVLVDISYGPLLGSLDSGGLFYLLKRTSRKEDSVIRVNVIGMGYVGVPLAVEFAKAGLAVVGLDVDEEKMAALTRGESYIPDVPGETVAALVAAGTLRASTDFSELADADAVCICVPTPLRKSQDPDISYIVDAVDKIAAYLHPGMLIVLESTTYPGTTEELVLPKLEETGLKAGEDFFLAFSPERVDPGNEEFLTRNTPKVIGGVTAACTEKAIALYGHAVDNLVPVSSAVSAEMVKLLENTFRAINIGMVNELALICDRLGVDVWEVIDAAKTKPFGFMPFYPGPGLGGHCIPIDPLYLSWKLKTLDYNARFIELASTINSNMPQYVVEKITEVLNDIEQSVKGSRVLVMGLAYKKDVGDTRESPALDIIGMLKRKGAVVSYSDPYVPSIEILGDALEHYDMAGGVSDFDLVVIVTDHSQFDYVSVLSGASVVFDTRNATGGINIPDSCRVVKL